MPNFCAVVNCGSRGDRDAASVRLFRLPSLLKRFVHQAKMQEFAQERRNKWIQALKRRDLTEAKLKYLRVCSRHFIQGEPAHLLDSTNPDWVPSLNMGYNIPNQPSGSSRIDRHVRANERSKKPIYVKPEDEQFECSQQESFQMETDEDLADESINDRICQTDITNAEITQMLLLQSGKASDKLLSLTLKSFEGDDKKTKYFTGLDSFVKLDELINFITPFIPLHFNATLTPCQQIVLTLIKLRINIDFKFLAYLFSICTASVSNYFKRIISIMNDVLSGLIVWPSREILTKTMPMSFKESFHYKTTVIVDCFEIFIEKPANLATATTFWSNYKHHYTVKYLIGITPQGTICFISEAWPGRASDKHITINSSFFNKISPGDVILADRGFLIRDYVKVMHADVKVPAFTRGLTQLHPLDIEETRSLANVRIHVERVIGTIRQKYRILSDKIPMILIAAKDDGPLLDKIVNVCCCLINLCPSVVPLK